MDTKECYNLKVRKFISIEVKYWKLQSWTLNSLVYSFDDHKSNHRPFQMHRENLWRWKEEIRGDSLPWQDYQDQEAWDLVSQAMNLLCDPGWVTRPLQASVSWCVNLLVWSSGVINKSSSGNNAKLIWKFNRRLSSRSLILSLDVHGEGRFQNPGQSYLNSGRGRRKSSLPDRAEKVSWMRKAGCQIFGKTGLN